MTKIILFISFIALCCTSCYSVKKAVSEAQPYSDIIHWPAEYEPAKAKFYVHNKIDIKASPEIVWNILLQAEEWADYYEGASNVKVQNAENGILRENSVFAWKTMGLDFESTIKEFVPFSRLSWESQKKSIKGYHAWFILPTETGCTLVTDESQHGWLTFMEKTFQPKKLYKLHDIWLMEIKKKAESISLMN